MSLLDIFLVATAFSALGLTQASILKSDVAHNSGVGDVFRRNPHAVGENSQIFAYQLARRSYLFTRGNEKNAYRIRADYECRASGWHESQETTVTDGKLKPPYGESKAQKPLKGILIAENHKGPIPYYYPHPYSSMLTSLQYFGKTIGYSVKKGANYLKFELEGCSHGDEVTLAKFWVSTETNGMIMRLSEPAISSREACQVAFGSWEYAVKRAREKESSTIDISDLKSITIRISSTDAENLRQIARLIRDNTQEIDKGVFERERYILSGEYRFEGSTDTKLLNHWKKPIWSKLGIGAISMVENCLQTYQNEFKALNIDEVVFLPKINSKGHPHGASKIEGIYIKLGRPSK